MTKSEQVNGEVFMFGLLDGLPWFLRLYGSLLALWMAYCVGYAGYEIGGAISMTVNLFLLFNLMLYMSRSRESLHQAVRAARRVAEGSDYPREPGE